MPKLSRTLVGILKTNYELLTMIILAGYPIPNVIMHFRANLLYLMSPNLKNDRRIIASHFENAIPHVY